MPWSDGPVRFYGEASDHRRVEWEWVDRQLTAAGTYWLDVATGAARPHPRPVWGVWTGHQLHLSIGSIVLSRATQPGAAVTVHLDSGTDVVIVEGAVAATTDDSELIANYDAKYDYTYDVGELGPLTTVTPDTVIAWRSAGWAGRQGFTHTGRWTWTDD